MSLSSILGSLQGFGGSMKDSAMGVIDSIFPPEKRAEVIAKLQAFAVSNPKLSAFLLTNIALTGLPLVMFFVFTLTVFVFSLVAALLLGILVALLFTVFMVGVALLVVLPTIFITTFAASFIFLWGLGGYYILKWFNEGESPAPKGDAIGDKINNLTGGRLGFLMDGARQAPAPTPKVHGDGAANGNAEKHDDSQNRGPQKHATNAAKSLSSGIQGGADQVQKRVVTATKPITNTAGTAKGVVSGVTGLG